MFYIHRKLIGIPLAIGFGLTVPEPVEGKTRRFDKLSDRRIQSSKKQLRGDSVSKEHSFIGEAVSVKIF